MACFWSPGGHDQLDSSTEYLQQCMSWCEKYQHALALASGAQPWISGYWVLGSSVAMTELDFYCGWNPITAAARGQSIWLSRCKFETKHESVKYRREWTVSQAGGTLCLLGNRMSLIQGAELGNITCYKCVSSLIWANKCMLGCEKKSPFETFVPPFNLCSLLYNHKARYLCLFYLEDYYTGQLHTWQVYCWGAKDIRCQTWCNLETWHNEY